MKIVRPIVHKYGKEVIASEMIFCPECMVTTPRPGGIPVNYCPSCGSAFKYEEAKDEHD